MTAIKKPPQNARDQMSLTPQNELFGRALALTESVAVVASEAEFEALLHSLPSAGNTRKLIGGQAVESYNTMEFLQTKGRCT